MLKQITDTLDRLGVKVWLINLSETESSELFAIKKTEDMRRRTHVNEAKVTVYRDFEADGKQMRGSSQVLVHPASSDAELEKTLSQAYENALNVKNPFFELPEPTVQNLGSVEHAPLDEISEKMLKALYSQDTCDKSFINSAEIFVSFSKKHTLTSRGTDVYYEILRVKGEFVTQCKQPRDVEMYFDFNYSFADTEAIKELSKRALSEVVDRANASETPVSGKYDVLICDEALEELMYIFADRCDASMIYPGYSPCKLGMDINEGELSGERINMSVFSPSPFSGDGIPMPERELIKDGIIKSLHGDTRFCRYLGIEPTGSYNAFRVENGSRAFEELKAGRVLMPVAFSGFESDSLRQDFGGEIRLAYLFENGKVTLLTGGSISGNLADVQNSLTFSKERRKSMYYDGPKAVLIPDISVAGK